MTNGNGNAPTRVRTGAYAKGESALRIRAERVRRQVRHIRSLCPWLEDSDVPVLKAFCELEVVGAALFAGILEAGAVTGVGNPRHGRATDLAARRLVTDHGQNRIAAAMLARELGLTPAARLQVRSLIANGPLDIVGSMGGAVEADAVEATVADLPVDAAPVARRG